MTEGLLLVGSLLASLTAFAAFILGVTRTARLRRREQLLRETMGAFPDDGAHRHMLADLHKATVAELVGRQLTAPWRVIWPWLAWVGLVTLSGQAGYYATDYVAENDFTWAGFSTAVFGDPFGALIALSGIPWLMSLIFGSQVYSLMGRAETVRRFYDGRSISRPESYSDVTLKAEMAARFTPRSEREPWTARNLGRDVLSLAFWIAPGLFVVFLGLTIGMMTWLTRLDREALEGPDLGPLGLVIFLGFVATSVGALFVVSTVSQDIQEYALPTTHDLPSRFVLPTLRRSAGPGTPSSTDART